MHRYACSLCRVIPKVTVVLPCTHALCEICKYGSGQDGNGGVCPLDHESFEEHECTKILSPLTKVGSLKCRCRLGCCGGHGRRLVPARKDVAQPGCDVCCQKVKEDGCPNRLP
ncbi:hypothetical protein V5799_005283 [Amblyomma americanum]|uniref:RING-type domain-containing protein n=1 Tax=Amblyomma americanum TaxID=6943 RepID=A0AAQ4DZP8_AMBAM